MSASSPCREVLPPVIELGRALAATDMEYHRLDRLASATQDQPVVAQQRMVTLDCRGQVLRDLIASLPAVSLPDVAVQIGVAANLCLDLAGLDLDDKDDRIGLRGKHEALRRMMLSVLPIVAKAAGLDPDAMDWDELVRFRAHHFGGEVHR